MLHIKLQLAFESASTSLIHFKMIDRIAFWTSFCKSNSTTFLNYSHFSHVNFYQFSLLFQKKNYIAQLIGIYACPYPNYYSTAFENLLKILNS